MFKRIKWWAEDVYRNTINGVKSIIKYTPTVYRMRDYDGEFTVLMFKKSLEQLCDRIEFKGSEVEDERMEKVKDMRRVIELMDNFLADNYLERSGYDDNFEITFEKYSDSDKLYQLRDTCTKEQKKHNDRSIKLAHKLENNEWNEIWDTIKKGKESNIGLQGWWD
tara:strand:- start:220 stop:714 length:495 start_codon:yes stop_codon:yes gene_type:complete